MKILPLIYPCRCIICDEVIKQNEICCAECKKYINNPPYKIMLNRNYEYTVPFIHRDVYREAILKYKYKDHRQYYIQFSLLLKEVINSSYKDIKFDYYTAIPCYKIEYPTTKFDRVHLIAKETARLCCVPYKKILIQTREKKKQKSLGHDERLENVKNIYKACNEVDINGKTILLFDDVVTTSATVCSGADALMNAGAAKVCIISITTAF